MKDISTKSKLLFFLCILLPGVYLLLRELLYVGSLSLGNYRSILQIQSVINGFLMAIILSYIFFELYKNRKEYKGDNRLYLFAFSFFAIGILIGFTNFTTRNIRDLGDGSQKYEGQCHVTYFKRSLGRRSIDEETRITLAPLAISVASNKGIPNHSNNEIQDILPSYEEVDRNYECSEIISLYYLKHNLVTLELREKE